MTATDKVYRARAYPLRVAEPPAPALAALIATTRRKQHGWHSNAEVPGPTLRREFALPRSVTDILDRSLANGSVTARSADQVAAALEFRDRRAV